MNLKTFLTGGMWIAVSTFFISLLAYAFRFIMIKNLSVSEYGLYYSIIAIMLFATTFIDLGITPAFVKYASANLKNTRILKYLVNYYYKTKIKRGIIFIVLTVMVSYPLAKYFFKDYGSIYFFIALGILYVLVEIFFNYVNTLLKTFKDQKNHSLFEFSKTFLQVILLLVFFYFNLGLWSPILTIFFGHLIVSIVYYIVFYKKYFPNYFRIKSKLDNKLMKKLNIFAYANLFFLIGAYILNYTDTYMLTYFTDLTQVGLYNVAVPTAKLILFMAGPLTLILMPLISSFIADKKYNSINKYVNLTYLLGLLSLIPIAIIIISYPELILKTLYSTEHIAASKALKLLALSAIFNTFFFINTNILNGINKPKINTYIIGIAALVNVFLNFILIPLWGINGAAFSTLIGTILMCVLSFIYLKIYLKEIKIKFNNFINVLGISFIFYICLNFLKNTITISNVWMETFLILSISSFLYISLLLITQTIKISTIKNIINLYLKK